MTVHPRTRFCAALTLLVSLGSLAAAQSPPVARVVPKVDTLHGEIREDDYFWLRDKQNPEVRVYLEAENAYTAAAMKHTEGLQEQLYRELLGRIKETDLSVPYRDHGFWYYTRTEQGKSYPIYCRRRGSLDAPEEVILDQNALAAGKRFDALGGFDVSPDGRLLLYLEHAIRDGVRVRDGEYRVVSRRFDFVELEADGAVKLAGWAPYLDLRPLEADELALIASHALDCDEERGRP